MAARKVLVSYVLISTLGALPLCLAGDSAMDRATLRGLQALKVVVDQPTPEMVDAGFDRGFLHATIEQKLREAGIRIDNDATEFLGLSVSAARASGKRGPLSLTRGGALSLVLSLGVYQVVTLSRSKDTKTVAETWGTQQVLSAQARGLDRAIADAIDEMANEFVQAYRAVNPK
jgi:hypothetical protein